MESGGGVTTMLAEVSSALTTVIGWVGEVVSALVQTDGKLAPLLPLMAIGISISALMLGVKAIKSFAWGT